MTLPSPLKSFPVKCPKCGKTVQMIKTKDGIVWKDKDHPVIEFQCPECETVIYTEERGK